MDQVFQFINLSHDGNLAGLQSLYYKSSPHIQQYLIEQATNNAFSYGCYGGNIEIIRWIRDLVPTINVLDTNNFNFSWACMKGHVSIIQQLREWAPGLDISYNDDEAFNWACYNGHLPIIKQLLFWKPTLNIYARNKEGLGYLLAAGHIEVLQYLIAERGPLDFSGIDIDNINNHIVRNLLLGIDTDLSWLLTLKETPHLECPICKQDCQMHIETQCGHKYCQDCITSWLERSICCPYCRRLII